MEDPSTFGYWVRRRRKALDLTQESLAAQVGCALDTIRKIESGARRPSRHIAKRLADQLELPENLHATFLQAARSDREINRLELATTPVPPLVSIAVGQSQHTQATKSQPSDTHTFLCTDIVGSTQLWERHPTAMPVALARHDALLQHTIVAHRGVVFKTTGDGMYAAFARPGDALAAAIIAQQVLIEEPWNETGLLKVRIVLHTGMAEEREGDYIGPPLNRAARLLAVGHGGQILLSRATQELVYDYLPPGVTLQDMGTHHLRDLTRPEHIFQVVASGLPANFPLLQTITPQRKNLPLPATSFIGREREVARVSELVQRPGVRLLTLTGPGGIGKTQLAIAVADALHDAYPDGVWFVALASVSDPTLVVPTIAQIFGLPDTGGLPALSAFLRTKALLLVLDNMEQLMEAAPVIGQLLAATTTLTVLITSRIPLRIVGEREYPLGPLALSPSDIGMVPALDDSDMPHDTLWTSDVDPALFGPAIQLFVNRAQLVRPDFVLSQANAPAVRTICQRLDGLPLAIELAAARVRLFPPAALLARFEAKGALSLLVNGARDLPSRQQTIRATIEWSYQLLTADEQRLLAYLSVFVGGFTVTAVEAVVGIDILETLDGLVKHNLIQVLGEADEPRLSMLETVREYAVEQLDTLGETSRFQRQHAAYYLVFVEQAETQLLGAQQKVWLDRLGKEHANLRTALSWSLALESHIEFGLRIAAALPWYWILAGHFHEGHVWLARLLAQSSSAQIGSRFHAKALRAAGLIAEFEDEYGHGISLLEESLILTRNTNDHAGTATALVILGRIAGKQGDYMRAEALTAEGLVLFQAEGDGWWTIFALYTLGDVALDQGNWSSAAVHYQAALTLSQDMESTLWQGWGLGNLGRVALAQGEYERAKVLLEQSRSLFQEIEITAAEAEIVVALGRVVLAQGDWRQAVSLIGSSLRQLSALQYDTDDITVCLNVLAGVAASLGQTAQAAHLFGAAEALREKASIFLASVDRVTYERDVATTRSQMDDQAFATAWAAGRALTLEQAIDKALAFQLSLTPTE